jgi:hypothetical protein
MKHAPLTGKLGATRRAQRLFADAVVAFSDDPGPANLERYLAASRGLEETRLARPRRQQARTRHGEVGAILGPDATAITQADSVIATAGG